MSHTQRGPPPLHRLTGPALTPSARDPSPSLVAPLVRAARLHRHASGNSRGPTQVMHGPPYIFDPLLQASSFPPRTHLSLSLFLARLPLSSVRRVSPRTPLSPSTPRRPPCEPRDASCVRVETHPRPCTPRCYVCYCLRLPCYSYAIMHRRANTVHVFSTDRPVTPCRVNDETRAAHTLDSTDLSLSLSLSVLRIVATCARRWACVLYDVPYVRWR